MARNKTTTLRSAQRCAVLAITMACTACSGLNGDSGRTTAGPPSPAPSDGYVATISTYVQHAGVCVDGTQSTAKVQPHFATTVRDQLATVVADWPAQGTVTSGGSSPHPGLQLRVRSVQTRSLSSAAEFVASIQAVQGLRPEPDPTEKNFVADDTIWQQAQTLVTRELSAAREAAVRYAKSLHAFVVANERSDIWGCLSAVSTDMPPGHRSIVAATDGLQGGPSEIMADFAHTRVLFVMPCPSGDAAVCLSRQSSWRTQVTKRGSTDVAFLRPEAADVSGYRSFIQKAG